MAEEYAVCEEEPAHPIAGGSPGAVVGQCLRRARVLSVSESVATAADVLRVTNPPVLPVVHGDSVVGIVGLRELRLTNGSPTDVRVDAVMAPPPPPLRPETRARDGREAMAARDLDVAPVVSAQGEFLGVVTRSDLLALSAGRLRPSRCGGMATPLGVYLTTGSVRSGAGDLGLVLAGATMGMLAVLSFAFVFGIVWVADSVWDIGLLAGFALGSRPPEVVVGRALWLVAWFVIYAWLFRLSPLAGYHAAEHMTVNAMESGAEITPDSVAQHSRVHPRCGTNLVVVLVFFSLLGEALAPSGAWLGMIALAVVLSRTWLGGLAQRYITTRRPTAAELESGVRAGRQLIEAHQAALGRHPSFVRRLWTTGLAQSLLGFSLAMALLRGLLWLAGMGALASIL